MDFRVIKCFQNHSSEMKEKEEKEKGKYDEEDSAQQNGLEFHIEIDGERDAKVVRIRVHLLHQSAPLDAARTQ